MVDKEVLRRYKVDIESESYIVEEIYQRVLDGYMEAIDDVINEVSSIVSDIENGNIDKYSNSDLEKIVIKIPVLLYKIGGNLERVGVRLDVTEALKEFNRNESLLNVSGTVVEKKAKSDIEVINEATLEIIYKRVYKQIDRRLNYIDSLYSSIKKVMSLRITELEVFRRENAGAHNEEG